MRREYSEMVMGKVGWSSGCRCAFCAAWRFALRYIAVLPYWQVRWL
jgi:CO dehydrogenase nickel-insertion accessory protein CooC1